MIRKAITLPEHHDQYPHLWQSQYNKFRIIHCCDDIEYIFQNFRSPKWRALSYHMEYESLLYRLNMPNLSAEPSYKVVCSRGHGGGVLCMGSSTDQGFLMGALSHSLYLKLLFSAFWTRTSLSKPWSLTARPSWAFSIPSSSCVKLYGLASSFSRRAKWSRADVLLLRSAFAIMVLTTQKDVLLGVLLHNTVASPWAVLQRSRSVFTLTQEWPN